MNAADLYVSRYSSSTTARTDRKLILSVDNELRVLYERYKLLAAAGYAVLSACDGVQALGLFSTEKVDLVLLDYNLPQMHGGFVAEAIKAQMPDTPIVMVLGADLPESCLSFCDAHVSKLADPEHLLHAIQQLLYPASSQEADGSAMAL